MILRINNKQYFFFNDIKIQLNLDAVASTFAFNAKFDPTNKDHQELFKPLTFPKIEIFDDQKQLLLTGVIVKNTFRSTANPQLAQISGYSTAGVLEDVNIPFSNYPLESINRSLKDITERLLKPFEINLEIDSSVAADAELIYSKSIATPTESIKSYIAKLASQRNIVLSHNTKGDLQFIRPELTGLPKIIFTKANTIAMTLSANGQGMGSEYTVLRQPSTQNNNLSPVDTIQNPLVEQFRPKVKTLSSGTDTDTSKAANNFLAAALQNIPLSISLSRFEALKPGDLVEVINEEIYLYNRTKFIVRTVEMSETVASQEMNLTLVLPETFTGLSPKKIFKI